jgi:hypothetical protein
VHQRRNQSSYQVCLWDLIRTWYLSNNLFRCCDDDERWEKIQQDTLKFSQYYYELKREKEAESEKSLMKSAAARFVELEKRPFEFEFLWSFHLRYQPAWMEGGKAAEGQPDDGAGAADVAANSALESATHSRHSSTTVLSHLQLDAHHHHQAAHTSAGASHLGGNIVGVLHPSGSALTSRKEAPATSPTRAVTSESQPKRKKTTATSNQASLLNAMAGWNEHVASMDATDLTVAEQERERLRIEDRRLQLQRDTLERSIIDMDLARLPDDLARQFYRLRKKAILQNLALTSKPAPASSSAAAAAASVPLPASVVASSSRPSLFFQ